MKKRPIKIPKFANEDEEATWWASREGRTFVKQKSLEMSAKRIRAKGSRLVAKARELAGS